VLVVNQDGSSKGCDNSPKSLCDPGSLKTAWSSPAFANLREKLAAGEMPIDRCERCVRWLRSGLMASAPPLRDYGLIPAGDIRSGGPSQLVVRLPLTPAAAAKLQDDLRSVLPQLEQLVLQATNDADFAAPVVAGLLADLAKLPAAPKLTVRTNGDDPSALQQALEGCSVDQVECTIASGDPKIVAVMASVANHWQATCSIRFVFTAQNWFQFEEVSRACANADIQLDLRVLDRDGGVPLENLAADELTLLRDVVASTGSRLTGENRPSSVDSHAHEHVTHELRQVLRSRASRELEATNELLTLPLVLPPPDHPWCCHGDNNNADLSDWWHPQLFGRAHLPSVRRWLLDTVVSHRQLLEAKSGTWLRAFVQRIAHDQHLPELLSLLRELYGDAKQRKDLIALDTAFADRFDLTRYGGPWSDSLGLLHGRARKRPFAIKKASEPLAGEPDITVLIPSFRHEHFIEETLHSVLAQRYGNFKILVVDDRSPDDTVARARSIDDARIDVRVNPENLGLGSSVLAALAHIDTPYVALLNSDDLFHPERLGKCRDVLAQDQSVNLVTTGIQLVDQDGGQLTPTNASLVLDGKKIFDWVHWFDRVTPPVDLPQEDLFAALLERNFLVTSSNLVCRTDWLRAQADGLRSLKYCLDWQLFMEAALEGALHHIHEPLIAYRLHASNTVWFREGRRWSYYLEVNRVAAEALQRFMATDRHAPEQKLEQVVDSVARHLATNTEMDGLALFLNCALDALQLDEAAANRPHVQELIEGLNLRAERQREAAQHFDDAPSLADQRRQALNLLLGTLAGEQERLEQDQKQWLRGYAESLEQRLQSSWQLRDQLEAEKKKLYADQQERITRTDSLESRLKQAFQQVENLRSERDTQKAHSLDVAESLEDRIEQAFQQVNNLRRERDTLEAHSNDVTGRLEARRQELADALARCKSLSEIKVQTDSDLHDTQVALAKEQSERAQVAASLAETTTHLVAERTQAQALHTAKSKLEQQRNKLLHEVANLKDEIDSLGKTREFRTGNFIWNKMPVGYISRRAKKLYRRLLDAKDRTKMIFKRRRKTNGTAVVAACWQWPIYSHTFVYQEMISLGQTGLDVQMFHWDLGDLDQLHSAFQSLYENRTQLQPVWESHKKDKEHFEKTRPGKLQSFLERIAPLAGKTVEELEKEPIVLQGCTFARMAELANARYIHSYFFYDQSFMAMQAAWLLDLPRGVSCYADHMMDDYPWKFVPLHIELCDVIVATSARIKSELSQISGGKFDDKIVVKPNGVDGGRFTAKTRPARKPDEPFEVLSVSRIEPKKGLTHLVEAIAELNKRGHRVVAHIIGAKDEHSKGSLEYAAEFEACITEHGLQDQVILHGMMKQEQMPPIIDKCRAFVAPYVETESGDKDGIPTAMLEALASSLPVITTNSGSIVEVIDDNVEGLIVAQHDSMAFADALETVLKDNNVEQRMAKAARARFDKDFDIKVTEKRLHERIAGFLKAKC
jgi:glycosyltransferase involved in cell wall biosynthesis